MDVATFELLCAAPREGAPSQPQLQALNVIADVWAGEGRPAGQALAEHLQGRLTEARCVELGIESWLCRVDPRALALRFAPDLSALVDQVAARHDFAAATRALAWIGTGEAGRPLHALVAERLSDMLGAVERRELAVTPERGGYRLGNGWWLGVFVRGDDFWRIDVVTSPDGFELHLIDFDDGPLAELNEYEPPGDVEQEVYGLGVPAGR
ncbi:MAG: hypothetical protein JNJ54_26775 [Myxococcaceae bacterium]|nr:hypothetical protein [Myxococcaceae bacterium]